MSWRVVMITKPSKLDYSMGYMVVRNIDGDKKVHLGEISVIIVENTACSVTCALLSKITEQKIKMIFCDEKRNPSSELTSYYGSHDTSRKIRSQLEWTNLSKQQAWTAIVAEKIKNQALVLDYFGLEQGAVLKNYLEEIEFYDESNREGHAAKVYFNALFGKSFTRSSDTPINAALNYGYSIILSCFNREVTACGYLTQIGIFHQNTFNQYNLSCDLMEPFRPIIDLKVKKMLPLEFGKNEKAVLVNLLNNEFVIDSRTNTLMNAIRIYSKSIFDAIENNDISLIKFFQPNYEL